jgi:MATE family multidrug resistance protein
VVLSFYSQEAFNAHVGSTPWYWTLSVTVTNLIVVVQVFVGQFNGEKKFRDIGPAVWQMIWFSLSLWIVLIPVVRWCTPLLLTDSIGSTGTKYLQIAILFIPISCISSGALGAFFTGRGKTLLVSCVVIASNVLNIFLDVWLVFGGWGVPSLGMTGAAIASAIAQTAAFVVLFVMFYHPRNAVYGVFRARLNFSLMFRCLRLGLPNAVSGFMVLAGMSMALQIMATYVSAGEFTAF